MTQSPSKATPGKPGLSTGRLILWALIAVLGGAAFLEYQSGRGHAAAWQAVDSKMDEATGEKRIKETEIQQVLNGLSPKVITDFQGRGKAPEAVKAAVYSWFTLNPSSKREIFVYYNKDGEVVQASTEEYIASTEKGPVPVDPDAKPVKGMNMSPSSPEASAKLAEGYQKYAPPHMLEKMKKEAEEAAKAKGDAPPGQSATGATDEQPAGESPSGDDAPADEKGE